MESLTALLTSLSAADVIAIFGGIIVVLTLLEKGFEVEFVGRRIFRLAWRVIKFFGNWAIHPIKPYIKEFRDFTLRGEHIEKKLDDLDQKAQDRDKRRSEEYAALKSSLTKVEREVSLNGGKSMKDAVERLLRHDSGTWGILVELRESARLTNLRLDLLDEADRRMSFRISPTLECTKISATFLRFFGYTEKDMLGNDWEFCIAERSRAEVSARWQRSAAKQVPYRNEQYIVDSDGKEYKCVVRGYPLINIEGEFDGFYGTVEVMDE